LSVATDGILLSVLGGDAEPTAPVDHPITLVVAAPERIEVRVLGPNGPAGRARTTVFCAAPRFSTLGWTNAEGRSVASVRRGAAGCKASAIADTGESAVADHVAPGNAVELRLRPSATLRGTIRPAPSVFRVRVSDGREETFFATGGTWELRDLAAGSTEVQVWADGLYGESEVTLAPGETRMLDLRLAPRRPTADDDAVGSGHPE
jgi:hypothetical protein